MAQLTTGNGLPNVVVTGIAMTTALATDAENTWKKLLDGQSGRDALRRTTASVAGMATLSVATGLRELPLQAHARALTEPSADIGVGAIAGPEVSG